MSTEELIASFPVKDANYFMYILLILAAISVASALIASDKNLNPPLANIVPIAYFVAIMLSITGGSMALWDYSKHQEDIWDWRVTTYELYLDEQETIEEEVTDYNLNEDGSMTVIAVAADQSIVPYQRIKRFETSAQGRNYISYVMVTGLESIGIPDEKELITFHRNK